MKFLMREVMGRRCWRPSATAAFSPRPLRVRSHKLQGVEVFQAEETCDTLGGGRYADVPV